MQGFVFIILILSILFGCSSINVMPKDMAEYNCKFQYTVQVKEPNVDGSYIPTFTFKEYTKYQYKCDHGTIIRDKKYA